MDIQAKIDELDKKIKALKAERSKYIKMQQYSPTDEVLKLVETIRENPGIGKKQLADIYPEIEKITLLLTSARRNFGLIENRGSRANSAWFVIK